MLENGSQLTRLCGGLKNLNRDFWFSKLSMKTDLENELMVAKFILSSPLNMGKYNQSVWDGHAQTALFKTDNQQGLIV